MFYWYEHLWHMINNISFYLIWILKISNFWLQCNTIHFIGCSAEWCEHMHSFAGNSHDHCYAKCMCLKSGHLYFNLSPMNNLHALFIEISYQAWFCLQNIISCNFIYNANGILKSWEFYHSCPSAGNMQSIGIISFSARRTRSHPSARHTTISRKYF